MLRRLFFAISLPGLNGVRVEDGANQARESLLDFCAARGVEHLHAVALAADEAILAQDFEVLRECGFGNRLAAHLQEIRAVNRARLEGYIGVNRHPDRIGERVEDAFDGDVFNGRMEEGPHTPSD